MNSLSALSARCSVDFDISLERRFKILQPQIAFTTAKESHEDLSEILANLHERHRKQVAGGRVDFTNRLLKRKFRGGKIRPLRRQELQTLLLLLVFFDGKRIHGTEGVELIAKIDRFGA